MFDQLAPETAAYIKAGNQAAALAKFDQAVEEFSRAIDSDPECREAYVFRSYAHSAVGDYAAAIADLDKAIDMDPDAELYQLRAGHHLRLLNFPEVIMDTTAAMRLGGDEADGYFRRGSAYLSAGDVERALQDLRLYVDLMGEAATPWAVETISEMENGGDLFQLTVPAFYEALGRGYLDRLMVDQAIEEFTHWIAIEPCADAYAARGGAFSLIGHNQDALDDLNRALEFNDDHPEAYRHIAVISCALEQFEIAIESFDYAISYQPNDAMLYFNRGQALRQINEVEPAIADFSRAIDLGMDQPSVFYERGMANMTSGQLERAMFDFNQALTLQPNFADAYVARGQASARMGYVKNAIADYKRAIEITPYEPEAHMHIGNAYHHLEDTAQAIKHLREYERLAGATANSRSVALLKKLEGSKGD
jgi:tetratricopeptide (TPR) repeat protein